MNKFESLIQSISTLDQQFKASVAKAVNTGLTLRNWLIGCYIVQYEQHGEDRAKYGDKIEATIAKKFSNRGFSERNLKLYKRFFFGLSTNKSFAKRFIAFRTAAVFNFSAWERKKWNNAITDCIIE